MREMSSKREPFGSRLLRTDRTLVGTVDRSYLRTGLMADRVTPVGLHNSGARQTAEGLTEIQEAYENTIEENQLLRDKNAPAVLKDLGIPATVFRWMTNNQNIMDTLQRYRTSAERSFYRALDKLKHLQEKRRSKTGSAAPIVDVNADEFSVS